MTLDEARSTLTRDADLADLLEAVGTAAGDQNSTIGDLILGLRHPDLVAEQAALALYRRTGRPVPDDRTKLCADPEDWTVWILQNRKPDPGEKTAMLMALAAICSPALLPLLSSTLAATPETDR